MNSVYLDLQNTPCSHEKPHNEFQHSDWRWSQCWRDETVLDVTKQIVPLELHRKAQKMDSAKAIIPIILRKLDKSKLLVTQQKSDLFCQLLQVRNGTH